MQEFFSSWAAGVITTLEPDSLPPDASPYGRNSFLTSAGGEKAVVMKRRGALTCNTTAITGTPAIIGQYEFRRRSGSSFTAYHLLVSDGGRLDKRNADNTTSVADGTAATPFTSGTHFPDFATANNLAFIVNGVENKKFNGTNVQSVGIVAPSAPTLAANAAAGVYTGTFEARITYYNNNTAQESSASATSAQVTVAAKKLDISWAASADAQVTHVNVYLRNTTTMVTFRRVAQVAIGTTTTTVNTVETALIVLGPDTAENNPPSVASYLEFHAQRMFYVPVATPSTIEFSKISLPESVDPDNYEVIGIDDGDAITGLLSISSTLLLIFKRKSIWAIYGDDPTSWEVRRVSASVGCTSHRSIVIIEGVAYFWSEQGPMAITGDSEPISIGKTLIAPTVGSDNIAYLQLGNVCAAVQQAQDTILFAVSLKTTDGDTSTRNHAILPYSYRLQRWHADRWDPIDVASFGVVSDSNAVPWVYIGSYGGQVFQWWNADNDGVPSGTSRGTVTSAAATTLTDSTATFVTTGAGLKGRYLYAIDATGLTVQRRRIGSNTGTVLTLDTGVTWSTTPNATYTYVIGGPQFAWDTRWSDWRDSGVAFKKKRLRFCYILFKAPAQSTTIHIDLMLDLSLTVVKTFTLALGTVGGIWDSSLWDQDVWGGTTAEHTRYRIAKTGKSIRYRIRNGNPDEPFTLLQIGTTAELLSEKIH
jgi:hypothetical protein